MASFTQITRTKRNRRHKNAGAARKRKLAKKSTLSYDELFADCGEPQPQQAKAEAKAG